MLTAEPNPATAAREGATPPADRLTPAQRFGPANLFAVLALVATIGACRDDVRPASPPNIVFVLYDDVGYGDVGAYGGTEIETPHLDQLAAKGVRFTRYYAPSPVCSPSRAGILTGMHPSALGMRSYVRRASERGLPADVESLGRIAQRAGYVTGHFGKWHLGHSEVRFTPNSFGFSKSVIRSGNGDYWDPSLLVDGTRETRVPGHLTDLTTNAALAFLRANRERPFFVNVWYHTPHAPLEPPEAWSQHYGDVPNAAYDAMVSHGDEQLGRILAALDELELAENTIVFATSDNGGTAKDERVVGDTEPFRGAKGELHEGGIRVPLIVRWPGRIASGTRDDRLASGLDFVPTFRELLGAPTEETVPNEEPPLGRGRSLLPLLTSAEGSTLTEEERTLFWESKRPRESMDAGTRAAVRRGRWKAVFDAEDESWQLFDLEADPGELIDLAKRESLKLAPLVEAYRAWREYIDRVSIQIASVEGDAELVGNELFIRDGVIRLAANDRFRIHDGDLSASIRLQPDLTAGHQTILAHPGSWRLEIEDDGRLHLALRDGKTGELHSLRPDVLLVTGQPVEARFTIYGRRSRFSTVRLYLNGRLEGEMAIRSLATSDAGILVGNDSQSASPFRGRLCLPSFRLRGVTRREIGFESDQGSSLCRAEKSTVEGDSVSERAFGDEPLLAMREPVQERVRRATGRGSLADYLER